MRILTTLLLLYTVQLSSQYVSRFDKGYNDGFKKGYCHNKDLTCFSPEPSVSPAPNGQENNDSYTDGFSRGVVEGISRNKTQNNSDYWDRKPMQRRTEYADPYNVELFGQVATQLQSRVNYGKPVVYYRNSNTTSTDNRFSHNYLKLQKAKAKVTLLYGRSLKRNINKKQRKKISIVFSKWIDWQEKQRKKRALSSYGYANKLEKQYLKTYNSIVNIINK